MRIFTKKSFAFKTEGSKEIITRPLDFADVPDNVKNDPMFKWGVADGDITVTETAKEETDAEKKAAEDAAKAKAAAEEEAKATAAAEAEAEAKAKAAADANKKG